MTRMPCSYCGRRVWREIRRKSVTCVRCYRERNAAKSRVWYAEHKAEKDTGAYWREHPEERLEYMRAYREKNRVHLRLYARLYARRAYKANKKLLADLPCDACGMCHTQERRATILRRMMPCSSEEIHSAWDCIWGPSGKDHRSSAGAQMLRRDLKLIGALSSSHGEYYLPRRAA